MAWAREAEERLACKMDKLGRWTGGMEDLGNLLWIALDNGSIPTFSNNEINIKMHY